MTDVEHAYHLLAKELVTLQAPHSLSRLGNVLKYDVSLTAHFGRLQRNDVQDAAVCAEQ